jgi:acetolactate synthase-1/2/3 large subunit
MTDPTTKPTAAAAILRSLRRHGVTYVFANFGTDHTPLIEALGRIRERDEFDAIPEIVVCPHEFPAMSAAHGYAAVTGEPQAVLVHVDVGTQNLGAAMHNAHRANAPVVVIAGLAPITDAGYPGSRDNVVHYLQDVFNQPDIVREYCRWTGEYRPPGDPDAMVARAVERAQATPPGPVYLAAARESLESRDYRDSGPRRARTSATPRPHPGAVADMAEAVTAAEAPLVVTTYLGRAAGAVDDLVAFAEASAAGVVEHRPAALNFPRDHDLHVGFDPAPHFDDADLVILAGTDVPWLPSQGGPPDDVRVIQIDPNPTKGEFPHWNFRVDRTIVAEPGPTLAASASRLSEGAGGDDRKVWAEAAYGWREDAADTLQTDHRAGNLSPAVLSATLDDWIDESTVVVEDVVTNRNAVLTHLELTTPGTYYGSGGGGLGWAGGAGVGVKMARPEARVLSLVGDGTHLFSNPASTAWLAAAQDAPTLTVIYDNAGWEAVAKAVTGQHPEGAAAAAGIPESRLDPDADLTAPSRIVDAHTAVIDAVDALPAAIEAAVAAVDAGQPAVLDVKLDTG